VAAAHVSESQRHSESSIRREGLAIKLHTVLRLPSTRADQKKRRKQEHGKEITEEGHEARSHQAVDDGRRPSLKVKSGCKFFINETIWTHQNWRKQEHGKEITEEGKKARSHQAVVDGSRPSLNVKFGCKEFMNETGRASALPVFFCPANRRSALYLLRRFTRAESSPSHLNFHLLR
jgi:hypothetical protein